MLRDCSYYYGRYVYIEHSAKRIGSENLDQERLEFYRSMSNFELNEIALNYSSSILEQATVFVSVLFAYIIAAYLVGPKLDRFQLLAITTIYSFFNAFLIFGFFSISSGMIHVVYVLSGIDLTFPNYGTGVVFICAWALSIFFMAKVRHAKDT